MARLDEEDGGHAAVMCRHELFVCCGVLDKNDVPEDMLQQVGARRGHSQETCAAALDGLVRVGLLSRRANDTAFRIHQMMQQAAQRLFQKQERQPKSVYAVYATLLLAGEYPSFLVALWFP